MDCKKNCANRNINWLKNMYICTYSIWHDSYEIIKRHPVFVPIRCPVRPVDSSVCMGWGSRKEIQLLTANIIKNFAQPQSMANAIGFRFSDITQVTWLWEWECGPKRSCSCNKIERKCSRTAIFPPFPRIVRGHKSN